ncbi:hypothetical protein BU15DRAFT_90925 [Melanogaster broomeanus]|nr:hypothetical protein BU15DRAFT_90925 [Melanogaster broomeanus]
MTASSDRSGGYGNHNPTTSVFNKPIKNETLTNVDKSPVTVANYSTQAVVNMIPRHAFPADPIVGKEDAGELCQASGEALRDLELANEALAAKLGISEERTPVELMDAIDRGSDQGARIARRWTLDPIDGTMGLLRGGQYAVCLAVMVDGGGMLVAVATQGANPTPWTIPHVAQGTLNLLGSVEAAYSDLAFNNRVSELLVLNIIRAATQMDSQANIYLPMLTRVGYKENIWASGVPDSVPSLRLDHAPGSVLVCERGGVITDSRGQPLDFELRRTLVLSAVQEAQEEEKERA